MSGENPELDAIRERYARRQSVDARYSRLRAEVLLQVQERQRALCRMLRRQGIYNLANLDIAEVGCGTGANLLDFISLGADPARLAGNDLLPERLDHARRVLPPTVQLYEGNAASLPFPPQSFDIVHQSTVFSSILDDPLQQELSTSMWRWVRTGGAVLWYDFAYDNPRNPDVRGIGLARIRQLFPDAHITCHRVTLAPPVARLLVRIHPTLCSMANLMPLLRTHLLCWIGKP